MRKRRRKRKRRKRSAVRGSTGRELRMICADQALTKDKSL